MTSRFVHCEFCQSIGDYQVMHMCPLCRRVVCRRCRGKAPLMPKTCARETPCAETLPPAGTEPKKGN